jgi:sugar phosphate isomerase/epimerase
MKLGLTLEPFSGISTTQLLSFAKLLKIDHIEINIRSIPEIEELCNDLGKITTTFHLPIWGIEGYEPGSTKEEHQKQMDSIIDQLNQYKQALNLKFVLAHPPEAPFATPEKLVATLRKIESPLVIENIPHQKDKDFLEIYQLAKEQLGEKIKGYALDAPHRYLTDNNSWLEVPEELTKELAYVHISDCSKNKDLHLPLGEAELPFEAFFKFLKKVQYNGIINQEILPRSTDAIEKILDSCLYCYKSFSKIRYWQRKSRYAILRPFLKRKLGKNKKEEKKGN